MADTNLLILAREFKKLRTDVKEVLQMPVGPQGLQGEKGEKGVKGDQGIAGRDGRDGKDGKDGLNGLNGTNGKDGVDGKDGKDGVSVVDAYIDFDGTLVLKLSNGNEINAGEVSQAQAENVFAMLKNGAASLNELLPSQTGNANKYLKTNGTNTSWDTLDGSDIDLSSPPSIGGTTPAAGTFTTLTATGQTDLGTASTNSIRVLGSSGAPALRVISPTVAGLGISAAGGASVSFYTNSVTAEQFRVAHTASAVNYVQVTGAATGAGASALGGILMTGSDANPNFAITTKGTGYIAFCGGGATNIQALRVSTTSAATTGNLLQINPAASGAAPSISAISGTSGTDTNIDLALTPKGTGVVQFGTYTATILTPTGYITIKDAGGTTRRVLIG